jgi:hypothetical protein
MASASIKRIDGREYIFGRIPPTKSVPLQVQLLKLGAPEIQFLVTQNPQEWIAAAAAFVAKEKTSEQVAMVNAFTAKLVSQAIPAISGIIQSADGEQIMGMMKVMFAFIQCDGNYLVEREIDIQFVDSEPGTIWKVFAEGLRVNFAGFFRVSPSVSIPPTATT